MDRLTYTLGTAIMFNLIHLWGNKIRLKNIQKDIEEMKKDIPRTICDCKEEILEWIDEKEGKKDEIIQA